MGTRHLIAVMHDGKYKVAQYGQWDGYPSGQGTTVLAFLHQMDKHVFITKLMDARFVTDEDVERINAELKVDNSLMNEGKKYGHFSRDRGAEILDIVYKAVPGILLQNSINFAADSLFCEYAYVIDLDKGTFEVFKGFNKTPLVEGDRFFGIKSDDASSQGYHPVKLVHTFQLDALPDEDTFLKVLEPQDEEE